MRPPPTVAEPVREDGTAEAARPHRDSGHPIGDKARWGSARSAVTAAIERLTRIWASVDGFAGRRAAVVVVGVAAACSYCLQSIAWPMYDLLHRDAADYVATFLELGRSDPLFPQQMLARPPVTPLVVGGAMELGGPYLLELVMGLAFIATVCAYFAAARKLGSASAVVIAVLLVLSFDVGALYHQATSDALFATGLALLALALARAWERPTTRRFALAGIVAAGCTLVRPSGVVLVPVVGFCLLVAPGRARDRLRRAVHFTIAGGLLLVGMATANAVRYDTFTVASGGPVPPPLYRLFVEDHLVSPANGPASAELGRAVDRLVALEPYRSYGITRERYFREGTNFMSWDLAWLARDEWGDRARGRLTDVLEETVRAHPEAVTRGALGTLLFYLRTRYWYPAAQIGQPYPVSGFVSRNGRRLPRAADVQLIPLPHIVNAWASDPEGGYVHDWNDVVNPALRFDDPRRQARYERLLAATAAATDALPARDGSRSLAERLNRVGHNVPSSLFFLALGVVALAIRRPKRSAFLVTLVVAGLAVDGVHATSMPRVLEYALPCAPLFVLFGVGALLGTRASARERGQGSARVR